MTSLPPGAYPPPQPIYAQQLLPGWEARTPGHGGGAAGGGGVGGGGGDGPFQEAFDFSFDRYATPSVVKVIYALVVVSCVLAYLGAALLAFVVFLPDQNVVGLYTVTGSPFPGIVVLVFGWVPGLALILRTRVQLEHALATVRTAIDVRAFRSRHLGRVLE